LPPVNDGMHNLTWERLNPTRERRFPSLLRYNFLFQPGKGHLPRPFWAKAGISRLRRSKRWLCKCG